MIITRFISIEYPNPSTQPHWYTIYRFAMVGIVATLANFFEALTFCYMTFAFSQQQKNNLVNKASIDKMLMTAENNHGLIKQASLRWD
jgi:hypothetical protein